jgi:anti-sigma factor RsiW
MNCGQSELRMMDALDGVVTAADQRQLMAHLETCTHCRATWTALNTLEGVFANPRMSVPASGFSERVEARIARFEAQRRTLVGGLILLGAAAALCLLAVPSLLNGQSLIQAYAAFLRTTYDLLSHSLLLGYRLLAAVWLTLDALAKSADVALVNVLIYIGAAALGVMAVSRALVSQRVPAQSGPHSR